MNTKAPNHYATLGLDRKCSVDQIRDAYRLLAKQFHPDRNNGSREAVVRTQVLNLAYEVLSDPERREAYDSEVAAAEKESRARVAKPQLNITQDLHLRLEEFIKGTAREVRISDPGNPTGPEVYELIIPAETSPATRFRLRRDAGGFVIIRLRPLSNFQFKVRGSDLRCDLKITARRAAQGGEEQLSALNGNRLRVNITPGIARGEMIRISGEGLPKTRGGRGDLLVRIMYRPDVQIVPRR